MTHTLNIAFSTNEHFAQVAEGILASLAEKLHGGKGKKTGITGGLNHGAWN